MPDIVWSFRAHGYKSQDFTIRRKRFARINVIASRKLPRPLSSSHGLIGECTLRYREIRGRSRTNDGLRKGEGDRALCRVAPISWRFSPTSDRREKKREKERERRRGKRKRNFRRGILSRAKHRRRTHSRCSRFRLFADQIRGEIVALLAEAVVARAIDSRVEALIARHVGDFFVNGHLT